jgi:hypothetical protein
MSTRNSTAKVEKPLVCCGCGCALVDEAFAVDTIVIDFDNPPRRDTDLFCSETCVGPAVPLEEALAPYADRSARRVARELNGGQR